MARLFRTLSQDARRYDDDGDPPKNLSSTAARGATINGTLIWVLMISTVLAAIAMAWVWLKSS